jgi:hypothetical protein
MKKILHDNGLSIAFFLLFVFSLTGQVFSGFNEHNQETTEMGGQAISLVQYLVSGHFFQATFENWESEFLQMALYLVLTMGLYQKGSSESKDPDKKEEVDREPNPKRKDAPWPVRKGGIILPIYRHSLSCTFAILFLLSFLLHWKGSLTDYNEEQLLKHLPTTTALEYLSSSRLWFESFQNWQSEFLSILSMVVLTIFLREQYSPQSKPVDAPNSQTGE